MCEVVRGGSPRPAGSKVFYDGDIPFLKVADLTKDDEMYVYKAESSIKAAGLKKTRMVNEGTLLLTNSGATLGVPKITRFPTTFNDGIAAFLYLSEHIIPYIYWLLKSMTDSFRSIDQGAAQPNLNTNLIKDVNVPLPPIREQKRIVEKIKYVFGIIGQSDKSNDNLQETIKQAKSKILDLAIHGKLAPQDPTDEPANELLKCINPNAEITCDTPQYGKLPNGWCKTTLGSIGKWQSGATPSRLCKDYYGGNIPWLKTGDLNDGIIQSIPEYITEKALEETSVKLNPKGSILLAMYGATIGKIGILSIPATTNQACCACVDYHMDKMFLFYFLLANRENFVAMGGGGAQPNISKEKITHTNIGLPPLNEQHRIVAKIEELFAQLDNIASSL